MTENTASTSTRLQPIVMPCPFCGGSDAELVHCEEDCCGAKPRWIQCPCGCELGGNWNRDSDAVSQWESRPNVYPIFDVLPRLWDDGYKAKEQDGEWWLFDRGGEGIVSGRDFRGLCVNIILAGL